MSALNTTARIDELLDAGEVAQAIELHRCLGGDARALLEGRNWRARPEALFGGFVQGDDLHREIVRYALWCARRVEHLWWDDQRPALSAALATVDRWLVGEATRDEVIRAAHVAAYAVNAAASAASAAAYAAAYAASVAVIAAVDAINAAGYAVDTRAAVDSAVDARADDEHAAQNDYLIDRAVALAGGAR